jgi:hypothetical protein
MEIKNSRTKANFLGGLMRRNFLILALATAFGMALLGSASQAAAVCTGGTLLGGASGGIYAIKVFGAEQDVSGSGTGATTVDFPSPVGVGGIGVIKTDGACTITGGEFIYFHDGIVTGPGTLPSSTIKGFQGVITPGNLTGNYSFNTNNSGLMMLTDSASGLSFSFGITLEAGNAEFRGARMDAGDPVSIIGEKQATVTLAQFETATTVLFDAPGGGGVPGSLLGVGGGSVEAQVVEHIDPLTGMTDIEGGGAVVFNQNGGVICDSPIGNPSGCVVTSPGAVLGDVHITVPLGPFTSDGTQNTGATFNGDFSFPLAGAGFNQSSVLWGTANQSGFVMTTATAGAATTGASLATAGKNIAPGTNHLSAGAATIVVPNADTATSVTLTITNDSIEPLDFPGGITVSAGLPDVVVTGSCGATGGDLAADTIENGVQTCTVILSSGSGNAFAQCTPGPASTICTSATPGVPYACCTALHTGANCAGVETGTMEIVGNDHQIVPGTQTSTGVTIPVTCK